MPEKPNKRKPAQRFEMFSPDNPSVKRAKERMAETNIDTMQPTDELAEQVLHLFEDSDHYAGDISGSNMNHKPDMVITNEGKATVPPRTIHETEGQAVPDVDSLQAQLNVTLEYAKQIL